MSADTPTKLNHAELEALQRRLQHFARFTDSRFGIPGTRFRIGLDGIIGFIPGIGDLVGAGLSSYVLFEAFKIGTPHTLKARMLGNIGLDFAAGLIPIVGDFADIAFRANQRNANLLTQWVHEQRQPESEDADAKGAKVLAVASLLLLGGLGVWAGSHASWV